MVSLPPFQFAALYLPKFRNISNKTSLSESGETQRRPSVGEVYTDFVITHIDYSLFTALFWEMRRYYSGFET